MKIQNQTSKKDLAYQKIRESILEGNLNARVSLSVKLLAQELGMSTAPVRDALHKLEYEGFLRIVPNQGIFIKELTVTEAQETYEFLIAIEEHILKVIFNLLTPEDFANLRTITEKQKEARAENDPLRFMKLNNQLHFYFHKLYFNKMIRDTDTLLRDRIFYPSLQSMRKPGRMEESIEEHIHLINALEEKNLDGAFGALERHINNGLSSARIATRRNL